MTVFITSHIYQRVFNMFKIHLCYSGVLWLWLRRRLVWLRLRLGWMSLLYPHNRSLVFPVYQVDQVKLTCISCLPSQSRGLAVWSSPLGSCFEAVDIFRNSWVRWRLVIVRDMCMISRFTYVYDFKIYLATFVSATVSVDMNSNVFLQPAYILHPESSH